MLLMNGMNMFMGILWCVKLYIIQTWMQVNRLSQRTYIGTRYTVDNMFLCMYVVCIGIRI